MRKVLALCVAFGVLIGSTAHGYPIELLESGTGNSFRLPSGSVEELNVEVPPPAPTAEIILVTHSGKPAPGLTLYVDGVTLGVSDGQGVVRAKLADRHYHGVFTTPRGGAGGSGFFVRNGKATIIVPNSFVQSAGAYTPSTETPSNIGGAPQESVTQLIIPPRSESPGRSTAVEVSYGVSVPEETKAYIDTLIAVVDPAIRSFLGAPVQSGYFTVDYRLGAYSGYQENKTLLIIGKLPAPVKGVDTVWDDWFTVFCIM